MYGRITIIAEVKTASPYGYHSEKSWEELFEIANKVGDIISVHTDPRWEGSFDLISKAKGMTNKPILAKGIHQYDSEIIRAVKAGADYVLVVGRVPQIYPDMLMIEPNTLQQLSELPRDTKAVWNERNIDTGFPKEEFFEEARKIWGGWLCQASYLSTVKDIKGGANAVLVGTRLEEFAQSLKSQLP